MHENSTGLRVSSFGLGEPSNVRFPYNVLQIHPFRYAYCSHETFWEKEGRDVDMLKRQEQRPWSSCHHCFEICQSLTCIELRDYAEDIPQFKVLASLQSQLTLVFAGNTFQTQHNLLCSLGLLVEHWLCLTTVSRLLAVVTSLSLSEQRCLYFVSQVLVHILYISNAASFSHVAIGRHFPMIL